MGTPPLTVAMCRSFVASLLLCSSLAAALPQGVPVLRTGSGRGQPVLRQEIVEEIREMEFIGGAPSCPKPDGWFEHPDWCDRYFVCANGEHVMKECEDGLFFNYRNRNLADPCDSAFVVECAPHKQIQEPTYVSEFCPRRHGTFAAPDATDCTSYYECTHGVHVKHNCEAGLHYDPQHGKCNWENVVAREGCVVQRRTLPNSNFTCPPGPHYNPLGQEIPHPSYADQSDCTKFIVCLNGQIPQPASCNIEYNEVFNERTQLCDSIENVPECADPAPGLA